MIERLCSCYHISTQWSPVYTLKIAYLKILQCCKVNHTSYCTLMIGSWPNFPTLLRTSVKTPVAKLFFKKKLANPGLFDCLFLVFSNKRHYNVLQLIYVKKCPSSIWCWDSISWPSKRELLPITTRPGLPPAVAKLIKPVWM